MKLQEITTERTQLIHILPEHTNDIHEMYTDEYLCHFYGIIQFKKIEQTSKVILDWENNLKAKTGVQWGIQLKENNKVVGTVGFHNWEPNVKAEIGFGLNKDYRKKGFVTEAINATIEYGFNELKLLSIEAHIDPSNTNSKKVLENTGFIQKAHLKKNFFSNGEYYDTLVYVKTNQTK